MSDERSCHYCSSATEELRPYGPGGAFVCFSCATATPERNAEIEAGFYALLEANAAISPSGAVAIGEPEGPRPFDPNELKR